MTEWWMVAPLILTMAALAVSSAFFSACEAAFFSLRSADREAMAQGPLGERLAVALLRDSQRLLTAILFWNLIVNFAYFTLASIVTLRWQALGRSDWAGAFATASVFALILLSEMLPKSLALLAARRFASFAPFILSPAVRIASPILNFLRSVAAALLRVLRPGFRREPYLRVRDLEMAVTHTYGPAVALQREYETIQNLLQLSDLSAEEVMRPRTEIRHHRPPLTPDHLRAGIPPSGYFLLLDDEDEVLAALAPRTLLEHAEAIRGAAEEEGARRTPESPVPLPTSGLERFAQPVAYVPWKASAAAVLETLWREGNPVAAVVNEFGETVGVVTVDDLLRRIFAPQTGRSEMLWRRTSIRRVGAGVWQVTGITGVRRLERFFGLTLPPTRHFTIAGVLQEQLERVPRVGDACDWGPFRLRVVQVRRDKPVVVEMRRRLEEEAGS
ncbi:MAG: CNNM domain-containing protein [Thermogutta sp.]